MLIAQISDFHLKPGGGLAYGVADTAGALERVVSHINRLPQQPDVILITGDIADGGAPESYFLAGELLGGLKAPMLIVPGNHDQKVSLLAAFPEHRYLSQWVHGNCGDYMCYCIEEFAIRLIGIDTVTPGCHGGGLGPNRLNWLDRKLRERPDDPTLIFMHHPPFPSAIGHMDKEPFEYREAFKILVSRNPQIERITCGHIHRAISRRFAGTLATVCPGVGMQLDLNLKPDAPSGFVLEPPALLLHILDNAWNDEPAILSYVSTVGDSPGHYGEFHPFFDVVSPM